MASEPHMLWLQALLNKEPQVSVRAHFNGGPPFWSSLKLIRRASTHPELRWHHSPGWESRSLCVCVWEGRSLPLWCQDLQKELGLSESSLVSWGRERRESPVVMWLDSLHVWYLSQRCSYFQHHSFIHLLYFTQMYIHTYIHKISVCTHTCTYIHAHIYHIYRVYVSMLRIDP